MQIVVLGDSIAQGLGVAGSSYADKIALELSAVWPDIQLTNFAASAAQLTSSQALLPQIVMMQPDVVVIAHGITEAIVRPTPAALRLVPRRWRTIGWLDPRPYFSRRLWKRLYHKTESAVRWRVKVFLIKKYGTYTFTSADEFEKTLSETIEVLLQQTTAQIILLTHNGIDERFYPHSLSSLNQYKQRMIQVAKETLPTQRVHICDVSGLLTQWTDFFADHFHPNATGHIKIADALKQIILSNSPVIAVANQSY